MKNLTAIAAALVTLVALPGCLEPNGGLTRTSYHEVITHNATPLDIRVVTWWESAYLSSLLSASTTAADSTHTLSLYKGEGFPLRLRMEIYPLDEDGNDYERVCWNACEPLWLVDRDEYNFLVTLDGDGMPTVENIDWRK